jgi:cell division septal protein FtsQ
VLWGLIFSPLFKTQEIEVKGLDGLTYPSFINSDEMYSYLNSLTHQDALSMVVLSTATIEETLDQIHGIQASQAVKVWPNKLVVQVTPARPVGRVGNQLVDADGQVLGAMAEGMPPYPELSCVPTAYTDCLQLLIALVDEPLFAGGIASISADGRDNIALVRPDGYTVVFGNTNRLTLKLETLKQILAQDIGGRKTIDVSSPVDPVAR